MIQPRDTTRRERQRDRTNGALNNGQEAQNGRPEDGLCFLNTAGGEIKRGHCVDRKDKEN